MPATILGNRLYGALPFAWSLILSSSKMVGRRHPGPLSLQFFIAGKVADAEV